MYGFGNPGRQDDGLGNECIESIKPYTSIHGNFELESNYQLNIEEAELISNKDLVIFIDASKEESVESFKLEKVTSSSNVSFTTHAASPAYILQLCQTIFGKTPPSYLLHIKGYKWEFKVGLSKKAKANLKLALNYLEETLSNPSDLILNY